jgi:hypothetical protein
MPRTEPLAEPVFLPNEIQFIREAEKAWRAIKSDNTWKAWWRVGAALLIGRNGIMRQLRINEPKGKAYGQAFSRFLDRHFPGLGVTKQASYILWLRSDPEREQVCEMLRSEMTPREKSRITDPNSMYKRVRAYLREREGDKPKRQQTANERIRELETLVAALEEQLGGRDFDSVALVVHWFDATSIDGIARTLFMHDRQKARDLADELFKRDGEDFPEAEEK